MSYTITDDQIRRAYLVQSHRLAALRLPRKCRSVVDFVDRKRGATAMDVAAQYGCSIQLANGLLSKAHKMGYLSRRNIGDPSGGTLYEYAVPMYLSLALEHA